MNNYFSKKNVIVTGGNSGSGLAISKTFLNMGSNVIRVDKKFDNSYNLFMNKCSSCHGKNREGQTGYFSGVNVSGSASVPNLVGFHLFDFSHHLTLYLLPTNAYTKYPILQELPIFDHEQVQYIHGKSLCLTHVI